MVRRAGASRWAARGVGVACWSCCCRQVLCIQSVEETAKERGWLEVTEGSGGGGRVGAGQATHSNEDGRQVDVKMTRSCPAEKLCPLPAPSLTLPWRSGGNS